MPRSSCSKPSRRTAEANSRRNAEILQDTESGEFTAEDAKDAEGRRGRRGHRSQWTQRAERRAKRRPVRGLPSAARFIRVLRPPSPTTLCSGLSSRVHCDLCVLCVYLRALCVPSETSEKSLPAGAHGLTDAGCGLLAA